MAPITLCPLPIIPVRHHMHVLHSFLHLVAQLSLNQALAQFILERIRLLVFLPQLRFTDSKCLIVSGSSFKMTGSIISESAVRERIPVVLAVLRTLPMQIEVVLVRADFDAVSLALRFGACIARVAVGQRVLIVVRDRVASAFLFSLQETRLFAIVESTRDLLRAIIGLVIEVNGVDSLRAES